MPNMRMTKNPMPSQDPNVRNKNFKEVTLGYTEEMALDEAQRCLNCKNMPCVSGCPVNIHIPEFIKKIAEHDFEGAYQVIAQSSSLPAVCGRVCPQETQCEGKCVRGIKGEPVGIGRLERFVADWRNAHATVATITAPKNGHKVAVIGGAYPPRLQRAPGRSGRRRPGGAYLRGRPRKAGLRRDDLRSAAPCRRRARVRHPGVPSAEVHRAEGSR